MKKTTTKKQDAANELIDKCCRFLITYLSNDNKPDLVKAEIIRKLFKLNPNITRVRLEIKTKSYCKEFDIRYSRSQYPELAIWRKQVFSRDNYVCQKCGERGGRLEAHHIQRWVDAPELRFDLNNGRTLCKTCHSKTDKFKSENNAIC